MHSKAHRGFRLAAGMTGYRPETNDDGNSGYVGRSLNQGPFWVPNNIVRHPYNEDLKRDPNTENYPCGSLPDLRLVVSKSKAK